MRPIASEDLSPPLFVGFAGASGSGKSAISRGLVEQYRAYEERMAAKSGACGSCHTLAESKSRSACQTCTSAIEPPIPGIVRVELLGLDDYFKAEDKEERIVTLEGRDFFDWDRHDLLDFAGFEAALKRTMANAKPGTLILAEGFLLYFRRSIADLFDLRFFLKADMETCFQRRLKRNNPPEPPGFDVYFRKHVWPTYLRDNETVLNRVHGKDYATFLDAANLGKAEILKDAVTRLDKFQAARMKKRVSA